MRASPDHWDIKKLIVQVVASRPERGKLLTVPLINLEGNPVYRIRNVARWKVDVPRRQQNGRGCADD
jgi:hypothetical protein